MNLSGKYRKSLDEKWSMRCKTRHPDGDTYDGIVTQIKSDFIALREIAHTLLLSGYAVNVLGVGVMLWGVISLRRGRPHAEGVLATGWAWTTAVFWRGANLRYWLAAEGEPLYYGRQELWLAPVFTMMAAAALASSLVLLVSRRRRSDG
jgi:hypothetical protein